MLKLSSWVQRNLQCFIHLIVIHVSKGCFGHWAIVHWESIVLRSLYQIVVMSTINFLPKCQLPKHGYSGSNILKQFCSINKFPLSLGTSFNQGSTVELFLPFFHLLISLIPCLPPFPPIILQNPYTVITREFRDNIYAKFWGATKVHYGRCESGKLITFDMKATSSL